MKKYRKYNPAFNQYLSAFTSGEISKHSSIQVRFSSDVASDERMKQPLDASIFSFDPKIKGEASWLDARTLQFTPKKKLKSGQIYRADLNMKKFFPQVPDSLESFKFQFVTTKQQIKVDVLESTALEDPELKWHKLEGKLKTTDKEEVSTIENLFKVERNGKALAVKWKHDEEKKEHTFTIDSLERKADPAELLLVWNGEGSGIDIIGDKKIIIPAKGNFKSTTIHSYESPNQHFVVEFSDPISPTQNLEGLVHLGEFPSSLVIEGNKIKVFPKRRLEGDVEVIVEPGITNIVGNKTTKRFSKIITFDPLEPEVKIIGKGTIIPNSGKLPFAFEAVALNAVDVRIIKIFEDNVPQFLQINRLAGSKELKRVGQLVYSGRVDLTQTTVDLRSWNEHTLDLSKIINTEPGAIYEVAIGFRKDYALCDCDGEDEEDPEKETSMLELDKNWDTYTESGEDSYWDYYYDDYNYGDRDNPCKFKYYHSGRVKKRNVLASDLGLIAKKGTDGNMGFVVTSLQTTDPESNVKLEVYDYQQRLISSASTDKKGMARVKMPKRPFLLVAKQGNQRGYLRLDDGSSLSLSRFDTQGKDYHKGIKGYIYAERGVWRPGDRMYINFILEDKNKTLPNEHPVTFKLTNPRGQLVRKVTATRNVNGFYSFHTSTDIDAPTGNYLAKVMVGGATFTKSFKVEAIVPNRLKIKFDFGKKYLKAGQNISGDMEVKWLHGAIAKNLKADVKVSLSPSKTSFARFSDYIFDDPARKFYTESKSIFDGKVNEEGKATISMKLAAKRAAPGKLLANFKSKVFEPGGGFSTDRFTIPFHPYQTYLGVKLPKGDVTRGMLLTDTDHTVNVVALTPEGNPVAKSNLDVKVYKLKWKWWWDSSNENLTNYRGTMYKKPIQTDKMSTDASGKGSWKLRVNYPSWGRYLVRVCDGETGHCTGKIVYIDWPGWAGRAASDNPGGASMLMFTSDKPKYQTGEEITLNIPTGNAGRALVSIESGSKVLQAHWVDAVKGMTKFKFKATPDMAPNIYVNVTLLQPHQQTKNDLPIRLYGIIPIKVENPSTKLKPVLTMADELEPLQNVTVSVSEAEGKPMTYTLAVVDEGLLDLTRFKTPNPWDNFYQREALKVKTWDMFEDVVSARAMSNLLSIGGDGSASIVNKTKQDRFKPVVVYLGPFELKPGQKTTHSFQMPNYVGSVRTMVVAADKDKGAYGSVEKATPVRKPLMALASLPRVIGPGETFSLPVTIFTMDDNIKNVQVSVRGNNMVKLASAPSKNLRFLSSGEQMVNFKLKAINSLGKGTVKVIAKSGAETAIYEVDIDVRTPNPRITDVYAGTVEGGSTWSQNYTPVGMAGTNHGYLEVSSIPPLNLGKRLQYLIRYPYGCIEQTTSSGFPQVYLADLLDLPNSQKVEIAKNVKATIDRLKSFQLSNGGFAYWPGNQNPSTWGTNYAGHFLLEAKAAGYNVPNMLLKNWKAYQAKEARQWVKGSRGSELTQAYRLFLLALAKSPEIGAMNRMRVKKSLSTAAKWNLAAAYHLAGQPEVAEQISNGVGVEVNDYTELSGTYGSGIRDKAIILQALSIMGNRTKATSLVTAISERLSSNKWLNTQATAYSLVAMAKYVGKGGTKSGMKFSYRVAGGSWKKVNIDNPVWQHQLQKVGAGTVEVKNESGGMMFAQLVLDGIPAKGDQTDASEGLSLQVVYKTMSGATLDPTEIKQGTDFKAEVTIKNTGVRGKYSELALNQIFPSGWEIHNTRLDKATNLGDKPEYQDVRDDRVYTFFDLPQGKSKKFVILLNASYKGNFYLPTITCEAMYDRSINARKHGRWIKVVE